MKKRFATFTALVLAGAMFAGCSGGAGKSQPQGAAEQPTAKKEGNGITIAVNANFVTLDPHNAADTLSISGYRTMYQGLLGFDQDMKVVPVLAESYEVSPDAKVYTFKLKENIKFHDGTPFNAEAVKINLDRVKNKDNNLKMARSFATVEKTEVVDAKTVKITLSQPYSAILNKLAMLMIISPQALEKHGKDIGQHPVGTGPFKYKEWVQGDRMTIEKNADYWEKGLPKVDTVTFKPVPENGSRVAMLKTGEADFVYPLPTEQVEQVNGKNGIAVDKTPSTIARYITMNMTKKPFDDIRVRQAINFAINKDAYIKVVKSGFAEKLDSTMSSKTQFYAKQTPYDGNVEKAKALLKEAGLENGFKAEIWGSSDSETVKGMQFVQQQLAAVGITLDVKQMEEGTLSNEINSAKTPQESKVQMWYVSWSPSSADADAATRPLFASEMFPPNGANTAYYKNDKVDELIAKANKLSNADEQKAVYADIQAQIYKDAPWVFLAADQIVSGKKNYLEGVKVYPDGSINVREAEIKK
ncbi:glutathione ABC transporter substrate-binding protein [Paenibacillus sp. MZ04-78.2]|uniref:glutathione ABC transporter substrate-binding protein n=1 Tax=Paenibacillus sp. MZ04-78.2 TaxID=2962034 RepID=UPI0020B83E46|nr:glutathione ABC transporter substrate-binding protein [Paenibacillus sp. MZ04-78.2]MCP3772724.1 glutathione ABC transporter substrate-binding protein [Paenibacillus sp. MZ04-78.2]